LGTSFKVDYDTLKSAVDMATQSAQKSVLENQVDERHSWGACGFAWVDVQVDGRSAMAKDLKTMGFRKSHNGSMQIWNPGGHRGQNVDVKEKAAEAFADTMRTLTGFNDIHVGSRLD